MTFRKGVNVTWYRRGEEYLEVLHRWIVLLERCLDFVNVADRPPYEGMLRLQQRVMLLIEGNLVEKAMLIFLSQCPRQSRQKRGLEGCSLVW